MSCPRYEVLVNEGRPLADGDGGGGGGGAGGGGMRGGRRQRRRLPGPLLRRGGRGADTGCAVARFARAAGWAAAAAAVPVQDAGAGYPPGYIGPPVAAADARAPLTFWTPSRRPPPMATAAAARRRRAAGRLPRAGDAAAAGRRLAAVELARADHARGDASGESVKPICERASRSGSIGSGTKPAASTPSENTQEIASSRFKSRCATRENCCPA